MQRDMDWTTGASEGETVHLGAPWADDFIIDDVLWDLASGEPTIALPQLQLDDYFESVVDTLLAAGWTSDAPPD